MSIFTIGHGTRSVEEVARLLLDVGVGTLVDVRRFPGSRRNPQWSRANVAEALPAFGIAYAWWGEELGGRRQSAGVSRHVAWENPSFRAYADYMDAPAFRAALVELEERTTTGLWRHSPVALMCAESHWSRCHRRLIADALELDGFDVKHIIGPPPEHHVGLEHALVQPHVRHPALRVDEEGRPTYDVGASLMMRL